MYVVLFFLQLLFWRCVNIYFYFLCKCFQNSIWTFFSSYVHNFFKIIMYFGFSNLLRQNWVKWYTVHELMRQLNTNFWIFELILISRNESDEISWLKSPTPEITIETTLENETRPPQAPKRKSQNMASIILNINRVVHKLSTLTSYCIFLSTYPTMMTFSTLFILTKNIFGLLTYLPIFFFNIVCERHLISITRKCPLRGPS